MSKISYAGYRFPPVIIQQAVWLYARFTLSFRDVEDLLAVRGIMVCYLDGVPRVRRRSSARARNPAMSWSDMSSR
jgi:transposase-like protein